MLVLLCLLPLLYCIVILYYLPSRRKAFLGPLYKEVEYLARLEEQAKEAGHKRYRHEF